VVPNRAAINREHLQQQIPQILLLVFDLRIQQKGVGHQGTRGVLLVCTGMVVLAI
jgi:hypothetical protein